MSVDYLGDGVYASFDGFHIVLKTGSHSVPDNTVYLDPHVLDAFFAYCERISGKKIKIEEVSKDELI